MAQDQFYGTAATYWAPFQHLFHSWELFCEKLLKRFNSEMIPSRVSAEFYSGVQGANEPKESFLLRKHLLYRRLLPGNEEIPPPLLPLMVTQLSKVYRPYLLTAKPVSLNSLLEMVISLEEELTLCAVEKSRASYHPSEDNRGFAAL